MTQHRGVPPGGTSSTELDRPAGVSVISPSRDNPAAVRRFLQAIRLAGEAISEPMELCVVDDSRAEAAELIRHACQEFDARYLTGPRRVGAKRNRGARLAHYDVLLFVDSDCLPSRELLAEHVATHRGAGTAAIGAVAGPVLDAPGAGFAAAVAQRAKHANPPFRWAQIYRRLGWAPTANLSVRAAAFWSVDGFDERTYTVNGGEDVDLGVRLGNAGWVTVGNPRAVVQHGTAGQPVPALTRKIFRYGRADVFLRSRHPERREGYPNRATLGFGTSLLALGCAATGSRRAGAVLALSGWALALASLRLRPLPAGRPAAMSDLLARLVDLAFDAGTLVEALRRGRPSLATGRFAYQLPGEFVPVEQGKI